MRETYHIINTAPKQTYHITWEVRTLTIENNSKYPIYVGIGRVSVDTASFDDLIAPFSLYNADPVGAQDFAILVDNATEPTIAFRFPVNVIFSSSGGVSQNPLGLT